MTEKNQPLYPVHPLIKNRWSPRAFSEKNIEKEKIQSLFEAARWAPSCFNEQPWRFIFATKENQELYDSLHSLLLEGNQTWAKGAPMLLVAIAKTEFIKNGKPNRHASHDLGLAMENLTLQALSMDLYVHQMGGFKLDEAKATLNVPEGYDILSFSALGYLGDPNSLADSLKERELAAGERKDTKELVFLGLWEKDSGLF